MVYPPALPASAAKNPIALDPFKTDISDQALTFWTKRYATLDVSFT